jgi:hypothetical protein
MKKKSINTPPLKEWVRDRIMFLAVAIFLAGAMGYIGSGEVLAHDSIWLHPVREFSLLISLIGVVSLGYELFLRELTFNEYKEALEEIVNPDAVRLGINGIFKNRSELGRSTSFEALFKKVQHEIYIGGSSLLSISTSSRELIKEKILNDGIHVKLLLMNPDSPVVELITKQSGGKATFLNEIKTSLLLLQKINHEMEGERGDRSAGKLTVHTYDIIPSHSFIAVDANESGGFIIADIGPYLGRSTPRPSMMVSKKKNGMFDYWHEMNNMMWEQSEPFDLNVEDDYAGERKTLVLTSGRETDFLHAESGDWRQAVISQMDISWKSLKGSQWIWVRESSTLEEAKTGTQNRFRVQFDLPLNSIDSISRAELFLRADDVCHVTVNDVGLNHEYGGSDYPDPFIISLDKFLKPGRNTIYFELICFGKPDAESPEDNRTGLIYRLHLEYRD